MQLLQDKLTDGENPSMILDLILELKIFYLDIKKVTVDLKMVARKCAKILSKILAWSNIQ